MTIRSERRHPDEAALIAWLDEPAGRHSDLARHVEGCAACAGRVEALRAVVDGLAAEPAMPDRSLLDARRDRILEALGPRRVVPSGSLPAGRRVAWAAALAAAALAALLLWSPAGERPPESPGSDGVARIEPAGPESPVEEAAERTAAAVAAAAASATPELEGADGLVLDDEAVETLAEIETTIPALADESAYESALLVDEFAWLSEEDQAAILDELSRMTLEL